MGNKNINTNKNTINIDIDLGDRKPKRRSRRRPPPPPAEPAVPMLPAAPQAFGISAYAPRAVTFAPSTTMIQPDNPLNPPPYFDKLYTNQQATLEEMRRAFQEELEDVRQQLLNTAVPPHQVDNLTNEAKRQFEGELPTQDPAPSPQLQPMPSAAVLPPTPLVPPLPPMPSARLLQRLPQQPQVNPNLGLAGLPRIRTNAPRTPIQPPMDLDPFDNAVAGAPPMEGVDYRVPMDADFVFNNPIFNRVPPLVEEPVDPALQRVIQQGQLPPRPPVLGLPPQGPGPIIEEPVEPALQRVIQQGQLPPRPPVLALPPQGPGPIIEEPVEPALQRVIQQGQLPPAQPALALPAPPDEQQVGEIIVRNMAVGRRVRPRPNPNPVVNVPQLEAPAAANGVNLPLVVRPPRRQLAPYEPYRALNRLALPAPEQQVQQQNQLALPNQYNRDYYLNRAEGVIDLYRQQGLSKKRKSDYSNLIKQLAGQLGIETGRRNILTIIREIQAMR
jgi:hypothetical protein